MTTPVKMGIVVTQPTDFIERNPSTVAFTRSRMEKDIINSGRLPDPESWKREELPRETYDLAAMTRFTLDAVSKAHVIVKVHHEGRAVYTEVVEVQIGTSEAAEQRADELNAEHGCDPVIVRRADGDSSSTYYDVETVPLGYSTSAVQVTQEFTAQTSADRQRAMRLASERMRG